MRKASQARFTHDQKEQKAGWNHAIAEAERQISECEAKIAKLRMAIDTFNEMRERGEAFILKAVPDSATSTPLPM
jgi:hypothetical protein